MAAATATKAAPVSTEELLTILAVEGEVQLKALLERVGEPALATAWARGEVEFGKTKYVVTGNPDTAIDTHNGVKMPAPALVIEGGVEWSGPKQRWHAPFSKLKAETLPTCQRYQKYQLEVCVNKEKDVWEWLEEGRPADGRETRYARRAINRAEAEKLFDFWVRLTDKGQAALTA